MHKKKDLARKLVRLILRRIPHKKEELIATGDLIGFLALLYRRIKEVRNFFLSPFIPIETKEKFIKELIRRFEAPEETSEVFRYMIETNSVPLLPEMKKVYDHEVERLMRTSKGHLYLADHLSEEDITRIKEVIQKLLGRDLSLEVSYDPSLIGGFIFKTSGFVVDVSVKRYLSRLITGG